MDNKSIQGLEDIAPSEWTELRNKIRAAKGRLIIIVHPFFEGRSSEKYRKTLNKILKQIKTPVLILEERNNFTKTKRHLEQMSLPNHMMIATESGAGCCLLRGDSHEATNYDMAYNKLISKLDKVGAKSFWIGGLRALTPKQAAKEVLLFSTASEVAIAPFAKQVRDYERDRLPRKKNKGRKKYLSQPLIVGCAGILYYKLVRKGKKAAWLPNVMELGEGVSPYPPPHERRRIPKRRRPIA